MSKIRLIIAGSRGIDDFYALCAGLHRMMWDRLFPLGVYWEDVEIVSGNCPKGVDTLGERFAEENGIDLKLFPADWRKHKKAAGPLRNKQMAAYADVLFLLWDGKSRGARSMFNEARKQHLPICEAVINEEGRFMRYHYGFTVKLEKIVKNKM